MAKGVKAVPIIVAGVKKLVINGQGTYFWRNIWLMDRSLMEFMLMEINLVESYRMVCEYWVTRLGRPREFSSGSCTSTA